MNKSIDGFVGFFDGRSDEEIERIKDTLRVAFPPPGKQMGKIIDAEDILNEARNCVECIHMAASDLPREEADPLTCVANIASDKIAQAIALLDEYCHADDASQVPAAQAPSQPPAARKRNK